jgi:hypothetical protein
VAPGRELFAGLDLYPPTAPVRFRKLWVAYFLRLHYLGQVPQPSTVDTSALFRLRLTLGHLAVGRLGADGDDASLRLACLAVLHRDRHLPAASTVTTAHVVEELGRLRVREAASFVRRDVLHEPGSEWLLCVERTETGWTAFALKPHVPQLWCAVLEDASAVAALQCAAFAALEPPTVAGCRWEPNHHVRQTPRTLADAHDAFRVDMAVMHQQAWACEWLFTEEANLLTALCGPGLTDLPSGGEALARIRATGLAEAAHRFPLSRCVSACMSARAWIGRDEQQGVRAHLCDASGVLTPLSDGFLRLECIPDAASATAPRHLLEGASAAMWWLHACSDAAHGDQAVHVHLAGLPGSGKSTALAAWHIRSAVDPAFSPFDATILLRGPIPAGVDRKALAVRVIASLHMAHYPTAEGPPRMLVDALEGQLFHETARVLWLVDSDGAAGHLVQALASRRSVVLSSNTVPYRDLARAHDAPLSSCLTVRGLRGGVLWLHGLTAAGLEHLVARCWPAAGAAGRESPSTSALTTPDAATTWYWPWRSRPRPSTPLVSPASLLEALRESEDIGRLMRLPRALVSFLPLFWHHVQRKAAGSGPPGIKPRWQPSARTVDDAAFFADVDATLREALPGAAPVGDADEAALVALQGGPWARAVDDPAPGGAELPSSAHLARLDLPSLLEFCAARAAAKALSGLPADGAVRRDPAPLARVSRAMRTNSTLVRFMCYHAAVTASRLPDRAVSPSLVFKFLTDPHLSVAGFALVTPAMDSLRKATVDFEQTGDEDGMNGLSAFFETAPRAVVACVSPEWLRALLERGCRAFQPAPPRVPVGGVGDARAWRILAAVWPYGTGTLPEQLLNDVTRCAESKHGGVQDLRVRTTLLVELLPGDAAITSRLRTLLCNPATVEEHVPAVVECWLLRDPESVVLELLQPGAADTIPPHVAVALCRAMGRVLNAPFRGALSIEHRTVLCSALWHIAVLGDGGDRPTYSPVSDRGADVARRLGLPELARDSLAATSDSLVWSIRDFPLWPNGASRAVGFTPRPAAALREPAAAGRA